MCHLAHGGPDEDEAAPLSAHPTIEKEMKTTNVRRCMALTACAVLAATGASVLAVELDDELARGLAVRFASAPNVTVLRADLCDCRFR